MQTPYWDTPGSNALIYTFVSNRHGKFYVSFAPMKDDVLIGVAMIGPFKTEAKAEKVREKEMRSMAKNIAAGEEIYFYFGAPDIPADVVAYITNDITSDIKQGVITQDTPDGTITGRVLQ